MKGFQQNDSITHTNGRNEMKRILSVVLLMLVLFAPHVYAADVYVLDEDGYGGPIGGFYSGLYGGPGATAAYISGEVTADKLVGGRLLWLIPADSFTLSEISVMASFLNSGGRIGFLGAWYGFATARDDSINAAISSLGGHISINTNFADNGYPHYAYRSNDRILSDPLTNGVDSFVYGPFSPLSLSASAKALVLGEDGSSVVLAYERIGAGTVFVMTSQSAWDLDPFSAGTGNRDLFRNMLYTDMNTSPLYAEFTGDGLYTVTGTTFTLLTRDHPSTMLTSGSSLYAYFASYGLYQYNGSTWTLLTRDQPSTMLASGSTLYAEFPGWGMYSWNGSTWTALTSSHPTRMAASGSTLYADFAGDGLYTWNGSTWNLLTKDHPTNILASGSILYADFASYGLYTWDGSTWTKLTGGHPAVMLVDGGN
jgi:hypothetical protein